MIELAFSMLRWVASLALQAVRVPLAVLCHGFGVQEDKLEGRCKKRRIAPPRRQVLHQVPNIRLTAYLLARVGVSASIVSMCLTAIVDR